MKSSRRQFLKITGLASGGLVTGLPSLAQFFDFIPVNEQNFLPVCGIFANPSSILDEGVHLRWSLPPSKGIPDVINIFRRKSDGKSGAIYVNPANSNIAQLPSNYRDLSFEGSRTSFSLIETSQGKCYKVKLINLSKSLKIIFSENITSCAIQLGDIGKSKIQIFFPDKTFSHEIDVASKSGKSTILISAKEGRPFKSIEIPLNFTYLYGIEYTGNQYLCDSKGWEIVGTIDNLKDINAGTFFNRISATTKNHYIKSFQDRSRYEDVAKKYLGLMKEMQSPTADFFQKDPNYGSILEIPFEKLAIRSKNSSSDLNAFNLLVLGCLDPNIARLAGLYFVDSSVKDPNQLFDYKVEANYKNHYQKKSICGVVLNIGGKYASQPKLQEPLLTNQIHRTRWEFDNEYKPEHLGKVNVSWKATDQNQLNQAWNRFVDPVVCSLQVDSQQARLIMPRIDSKYFYFVDQQAKVGVPEVIYRLIGIDLFGQESNEIKLAIKLKDNDIPACPVRLNFNQSDEKTYLNFEYGGFQYLTDPEISKMDVFLKKDSIYNQNVKIRYTSYAVEENDASGNKRIAINFEQPISSATRFLKLHFIESIDGVKLPAAKRKKFKIVEQTQQKVLILLENEDNFLPESNGIVLLEADTRDKENGWIKNNENTINFRPPLQSRLLNYNHFNSGATDSSHFTSAQNIVTENSFKAFVTKIEYKKHSDNLDLFGGDANIENDLFTEVTINRTINESDIFSGGVLKQGQSKYVIASQNAGYSSPTSENYETKLTFGGHISLNQGEIFIIPPSIPADSNGFISNYMVFWLSNIDDFEKLHTGEFLLRGTKLNYFKEINEDGQEQIITSEEPVHLIATLLSDFYKHNNQLQVLVRLGAKTSFIHTKLAEEKSNKVLYFQPYNYNITETLNSVQLQPKDAFKNFYFTANAIDKSGNESPLSLIAQFIKTRSKNDKPLAPSRPFPCDQPNAAEAYLKLPNSAGNSYFTICWTGSLDYRYEVGRALDKSIIVSHRDLWLKGLAYSSDSEQALSNISITNIGALNSTNGTVELIISTAVNFDPTAYFGGRLYQLSNASKKFFEILKIVPEDNNRFKFLLRPMKKGEVPSGGDCTIYKLPDYKAILENDALLIALANIKPTATNREIPDGLGAFNIVTGQPIRDELRFLDEVPGSGKSRFLYKVRAVDGSENRSLWSEASVPVWQLDVSVPEKIDNLEIQKIGNSIYLSWKNVNDKNISHYKVYKKSQSDYDLLVQLYLNANNAQKKLNYLPIRITKSQIDLSFSQELIHFISNDNRDGIIGVFQIDHETNTQGSVNYIVNNVTTFNGAIITNINPLLENDTQLVLTILKNKVFSIAYNRLRSKKLIVKSQKIILDYPYEINEVIGIYKFDEFDHDKIPIANQDATNYFINSNSFDSVKNEISNITNIAENTEVIVIVRGDHKSTLFTNNENPILFIDNAIQLTQGQLDSSSKIIGIFKNNEYDRNKLFEEQVCYNYVIGEISRVENNFLKGLLSPKTIFETFIIKQRENNEDIVFSYHKTKFEYKVQLEPGQTFDLEYTVRPVKTVNNISTQPIYIEANK